ncbi:MAG: hypothetical protein KF693_05420 [Nitrospira sp.]|nr:hypothetical protein [Nitrospira sp.]
MNPRILILLWLLPFVIPFIISIGAVFGIIPFSVGTSPRLPIISTIAFAFLLSVVIWKWRSPEIQARLSALSATRNVDQSPARNLMLIQSLMIVLFTIMGVGAGVIILNAGQIQRSRELLVVLSTLAILLSIAAIFYTKKVKKMATKASQDKSSQETKIRTEKS